MTREPEGLLGPAQPIPNPFNGLSNKHLLMAQLLEFGSVIVWAQRKKPISRSIKGFNQIGPLLLGRPIHHISMAQLQIFFSFSPYLKTLHTENLPKGNFFKFYKSFQNYYFIFYFIYIKNIFFFVCIFKTNKFLLLILVKK